MNGCRRTARFAFVLCLALLGAASTRAQVKPLELYVSPLGDDNASGAKDAPLATLARAQARVREYLKTGPPAAPVRVVLRGGMHFLKTPLIFSAEDSGSEAAPVIYASYPGETAVISGAAVIRDWTPGSINGRPCWVADVPGVRAGNWNFRELFIGEVSRPRTRLPKAGFFRFDETNPPDKWDAPASAYKFSKGDLKNWANLGDIDLVMLNRALDGHCKVAGIDEAAGVVRFAPRAALSLTDSRNLPARYYIENVKEALSEPGQWHLDRPAGKLYYLPLPGERPEDTVAYAPRLQTLVNLVGSDDAPVSNIRFERLAFRHAESARRAPADFGAHLIPGAVGLIGSRDCAFFGCQFSDIGGYAAEVGEGSDGNRFIACRFDDLGAGAVRINSGSQHTTVADCTILHGGRIWLATPAVLIQDSPRNRILHNEIGDLFTTAISSGWTRGYGPTHTYDNRIEHNRIHDVGRGVLDDISGIRTLGAQAGSVIRANVIHDVENYAGGGYGICADEGSAYLTIEGNLVYRTKRAGFQQRYGRDNIVRNNIFALAGRDQLARSFSERINSFSFERNIVYLGPQTTLFQGLWDDGNFMMRDNIYWSEDGDEPDFLGHSLAQWQRMGRDLRSIVADPLFNNPDQGDFLIRGQSPALKMGFRPIDPILSGPRRLDPAKVALEKWPRTEEPPRPIIEGRLEDVDHQGAQGKERFQKGLRLRPEQPREVIYHLWNCGQAPASGDVRFRILPPEAARIAGDVTFHYNLKPNEKALTRIKVIGVAGGENRNCRLVVIPHGPGLPATSLTFGPLQPR